MPETPQIGRVEEVLEDGSIVNVRYECFSCPAICNRSEASSLFGSTEIDSFYCHLVHNSLIIRCGAPGPNEINR